MLKVTAGVGIKDLAEKRRELRWAKEKAADSERHAHAELVAGLAKWKSVPPNHIKLSNVYCSRAPADLGCVYVKSSNPMRNPCVFCGGMEEDVF